MSDTSSCYYCYSDDSVSSVDNDETMYAYVDGSCIRNGRAGAQAGWGVWWENPHLRYLNKAGRLAGNTQSNNRAELTAIIMALDLCPTYDGQLVIFSDSLYCIKTMTIWLKNWRRYGWTTYTGHPVKNRDLIEQLDGFMDRFRNRPILRYIPAHRGEWGNEKADRMARHGASLRRPDWD